MSLFFLNMLSRFVIAFLPRIKCLLISWLLSLFTVVLEPKKIKSVLLPLFPLSTCHEVMGLNAIIFIFWMLFQTSFVILFFRCHKMLFSSSSLSAIRLVSSAYLRLLTFLPAILILACDSSSQRSAWWTLHVIYLLPNLINSKLVFTALAILLGSILNFHLSITDLYLEVLAVQVSNI